MDICVVSLSELYNKDSVLNATQKQTENEVLHKWYSSRLSKIRRNDYLS